MGDRCEDCGSDQREWAVLDVTGAEAALVDYCAGCQRLTGYVRVERGAAA